MVLIPVVAAVILFVSAFADLYLGMRTRDRSPFIGAAMLLCIACALPGLLGIVAPLRSAAAAVIFAAAAAGVALTSGRHGAAGEIITETRAAFGRLGTRIRSLGRRAAALAPRDGSEDTERIPVEAVAEAVATRAIPALREDPALGIPPEPVAIADASPVPPPYAALAAWIGGFEAEDDQELRMFMEGCAAGSIAVAAAWHQAADRFLDSRLHPAFVAGILEVGDSEAESASHKVQAHRRFGVIYGAVKQWIGGNGPLPKDGDFLTGEDAA